MRVFGILFILLIAASPGMSDVILVPDDYTTIQAAIDAAVDGDEIHVAADTYDEVLTINKAIGLFGAGAVSTTLTYTNTGATREQLIMLGANTGATINGSVTIDGFTLRYDVGLTGDSNLIKFRANSSSGLISITYNVFDMNGSDASAIEEAYDAGNFLIGENEFIDCRYAMWFNTAHDGTITANTLTNSRIGMGGSAAVGTGPRDMVFADNVIDGPSYGIVFANNLVRIDVIYNDILNCTAAGVLYWNYGPAGLGDVHFNYNNIVGNAVGFLSFSGDPLPVIVDGTLNWWGDTTGPSGGLLDPITGTPANGTGDSIQLVNLAFDPWQGGVVPGESMSWGEVKALFR